MRDVDAQLVHDMRNTAMVLREAATQLHESRETLSPEMTERLTEMLARRSDMLLRLLNDLSTAHLAERGELDLSLQRVFLADICGEVLAERHPRTGVRIIVDVADDAVAIADPIRIVQVLDNLLTNALRYGGPTIRVSAKRADSQVRLTVSDNGPGVPDELVQSLFDAYVRGSESHSHGGSGLGLLIVHQLCDAMGGTIEYDGSESTEFTATFPAVPMATAELGVDVAGAGHSVAFWNADEDLIEDLLSYTGHGLASGEAVLVTATRDHLAQLEKALAAIGIDTVAAAASGQYLPLDADALRLDLRGVHNIDDQRFEELVHEPVERLRARWRSFRVFGEMVNVYWRNGENDLALEIELRWNQLRADAPFPLMCAYQLAHGEGAGALCECHDTVVSA